VPESTAVRHGAPPLEDIEAFVFDIDGTLVRRGADGHPQALPGALEVIERIRGSGRPFVLFTNGSHITPAQIAAELRGAGLPIGEREVLTPVCSAISYLERRHRDRGIVLFATPVTRERMAAAGVRILEGEGQEHPAAVLVTHVDAVEFTELERACRALRAGAPLLTASYAAAYAGANGPILSRGAMVTAAIAKVGLARPRVVGKPSAIAVQEVRRRLDVPTAKSAVIGDVAVMDIALGNMGGSRTVLVRSGISGTVSVDALPPRSRPDAVIDSVAELLEAL